MLLEIAKLSTDLADALALGRDVSRKNLLLKHVNWLFWRMIYYTL